MVFCPASSHSSFPVGLHCIIGGCFGWMWALPQWFQKKADVIFLPAGKFLPYVGNQVEFPVPPGILNYSGENTVGLSIWNQDEAEASVSVSMKVLGVYASTIDTAGLDTEYLRPAWEESRLQYA